MTQIPFLEDFASASSSVASHQKTAGDQSSEARASFDEGYKCGWQDGAAASETSESNVRESLSSALQELNFTYFEAREHAMQSMRPVLQAMVDVVLPQMLAESLGARVVEVLDDAAQTIDAPVSISCAPEVEDLLRELVTDVVKFPLTVESEPTLTASQAILHLNDGQTRVDLDATLDSLRKVIDAFFEVSDERGEKHA
ncbi:hypothetical protein [uncultured Litoreibacter sp.]|uniref:hypothetical protein n=1 Tax=uncultured Litoreibacter sp. TaxID=1392394 RepID=UPI00260CF981|nr:hypothetical protein [uncultured Litoreibacter sp.]